jgi:polysaccharide deacetylase 2 family uncharacterized protein YibQ
MDKKVKIAIWIVVFLMLLVAFRGCRHKTEKFIEKNTTTQEKKLSKKDVAPIENFSDAELVSMREKIESFLQENKSEYKLKENPLEYQLKLEEGTRLNISSEIFDKESLKKGNEEYIKFRDKKENIVLTVKITYFTPVKLAILIDDVGMNTSIAQEFLKTGMEISFAVLPFLPKSKESNELLRKNGYMTILHMPMAGSNERLNTKTPGLISTDMKKEVIYDMFDAAIENVGKVEGFNNHMGSIFTSDEAKMSELLRYASDKRLFYVDSKTSINNMGYGIAKKYGIKTYYCSNFLDNDKDVEKIKDEIRFSVKLAKNKGKALVIGHYHNNMAKALLEMRDYLSREGIKLVSVKEVLE